jgi:hypothetical protein
MILGELLRPRPQDNTKAATLKDFSFPTAEETRAIPAVFGTVKLDAANVVWYGDLKSNKITKRVRSGLFSHDNITLGYRYAVGMHFALCHGKVDALKEILCDDKSAWTGSATGTSNFTVDSNRLFGGDEEDDIQAGAEGGVYASCTFYDGDEAQAVDSYLSGILTNSPAYRGVSHLVWKGSRSGVISGNYFSGYIGTNQNLKPMAFVVKRIPKFINSSYWNINSGDANPADCIYEILTNDRWHYAATSIDFSLFKSGSTNCPVEARLNGT